MNRSASNGPLAGIRVIDLTSVIMGPYATHILADMGADVIKIESPEGDTFRNYRPLRHAGMSGSFLNLHRNKRGIVLDLKRAQAREALDLLVRGADVFVHNLRPRAANKLRLDYEAVRAQREDIVYCGAYGFGADGPYGDKAAYDDLIQAGSGLAGLYASVHGEPQYCPTVICDKVAGQAIASAILGALLHRARGGGGQAIEVPMFETAIEFMLVEHYGGGAFDPPLGRIGFQRLLSRQRKPYRTADGHACILPYSDQNWREFFMFVGRHDLLADVRFRSLPERVQNIDALYRVVEEEAGTRTTAQWVEFCDRVSIPCMPVMDLNELQDDPHVRAVGLFERADHPSEGPYRPVRSPVRFSATPYRLRSHAPALGEHTREVLAELGLSKARIEEIVGLEAG